ncbi:PadR family transcriptional regulator [Corallococcus sp. AB049A]|uniref:PadR family transcriptional regulator n=1 Tax=Corallococcus interemptor TaxID=2316720 RepID=A0A3A8QVV6_9BACT|nr:MULTISPECIES: PadR family transcriptional regulator [Corallococcus]RKH50350.1 PadR family transcriptional regulator [Corallococcus sp. AB050B]RKH68952.1 PadR family transcriptional regulator [Corallococcus interemptor]RKI58811.1 PadR family transcriptional regulator [Corallococcus sp. AB049A]
MARESTCRFAILGMLCREPMSGYDLRSAIERSVGHFWQESYGNLYPTLERMAEERLVELEPEERSPGGRVRKVYRVTAAGRTALAEWLRRPVLPHVERNELLLKLFFGARVGPADSLAQVERSRAEAEALLAALRLIDEDVRHSRKDDPEFAYWYLSIRAGLLGLEAHLRWCDEAREALERLKPATGSTKKRGAR